MLLPVDMTAKLHAKRSIGFLVAVVLVGLVLDACGSGSRDSKGGATLPASPESILPASSIDCTATNPACPEIVVQGDAPASFGGAASAARGYADPSIRKDPASNTLWLAYSWPHLQTLPGGTVADSTVVAVDSHLARSDDGGATWRFVGSMWTSKAESGDAGESGWRNQEVVSLAPSQTASGTVWYSARESYFTRAGNDGGPKVTSFTIRVASATSPARLAQAEEVVLGGDLTLPYWKIDFSLDSLSTELAGCIFRDPGVFFQNGALYLAAECSLFTRTGERTEDEFVGMFATQPGGSPKTWKWRYLGKLANHADAVEIGGEMLDQTEIDVGPDGRLLAIFSPSKPSSPLATHFGCKVVDVASLDPPKLGRDASGHLVVRASATVSDVGPYGPAACSYDRASATGLVIVRRQLKPGLIVSLNSTGLLRP